MSMDRSLKGASALVRHRNVLTRAERMARMQDEEKWAPGRSIYGLPKFGNRKMDVGKAVKEETADGATPAAGAAAPAAKGAAGAKGAAPAAKGAAPAAGAKGAAPGAKGAAPAGKGAAPAKAAAPAAKKK